MDSCGRPFVGDRANNKITIFDQALGKVILRCGFVSKVWLSIREVREIRS